MHMNILVVVAHPDDELLGMGGSLLKHKDKGDQIYIHILTDGHSSRISKLSKDRFSENNLLKRLDAAKKVAAKLGVNDLRIDKFDDQMLDVYSITEIVKSIESFGAKVNPSIIYTHFRGDLNRDHQITYLATITAFRPAKTNSPLKIICGEIPSSTEWGIDNFKPNYFVDISGYLKKKIELLKIYNEELREHPHPRSLENIKNTAKKWGSHIYSAAAEAFLIEREIWQ